MKSHSPLRSTLYWLAYLSSARSLLFLLSTSSAREPPPHEYSPRDAASQGAQVRSGLRPPPDALIRAPLSFALGMHMNLDELANSVPESELREKLLHWVGEWKKDDQDVEALAYLIEIGRASCRERGKMWV